MMQKTSLPISILAVLSLIFLSIQLTAPKAVELGTIDDTSFSVLRAYTHLQKITEAPHMIGSAQQQVVREYIMAECKTLGFSTEVQDTSIAMKNWNGPQVSFVKNIIAIKKGIKNTKPVVIMAHYDSEPNTSGAGDDGAAVACMLETARVLQKSSSLQNDIILLFTDGEEVGRASGAAAFVQKSIYAKNIGIVLNFEGRGNGGPSNMFEVNEQNGWAINQYANAAAQPFANSLNYEIYKKMPNGTDYTVFKNAGITGLNSAYIDGYVNYHSPTDKAENLDLRSMQQHGQNMLSLAKHFGNLNIDNTKAPDISYFNVIGSWFIHYPAAWNLYFVILINLFFIGYFIVSFKKQHIKIGQSIISIFLLPAVFALVFFATKFLVQKIIQAYPMYTHFYDNNSYNAKWYFLALSAFAVMLFSTIYSFVSKKIQSHTLYIGILFTSVLFLDMMQYVMPSASYVLFVPLFFILLVRFILLKNDRIQNNSLLQMAVNLVGVIPALFILSPIIYFTFIAFGLGNNMLFVPIVVALFTGLLLNNWLGDFKNGRLTLPFLSALVFISALFMAHQHSTFSKIEPLQTSIKYDLNITKGTANWTSYFTELDPWSKQFFTHPTTETSDWGESRLINNAPMLPLPAPTATILKDSTADGKRFVLVNFMSNRPNAIGFHVSINDSSAVTTVSVNQSDFKATEKAGKKVFIHDIDFMGNQSNAKIILFELPANQKLKLTLSDRTIGLPEAKGFDNKYPENIIPSAYGGSNLCTVRVGVEL